MTDRPRQFLPGLRTASTKQRAIDSRNINNAAPGNGPLAGLTDNYSLNLVNFDWVTWHDYEWDNWVTVDALIFAAVGFLNLQGVWRANTAYTAGMSVFDPVDTKKVYLCLINHTSGTNFDTDKPLYWELRTDTKPPVTSVFQRIGDIVALETDYSAFFYTKAQIDASQTAQDDAVAAGQAAQDAEISANTADILALDAIKADTTYVDAADLALQLQVDGLTTDLDDNYYTKTEQDATDNAQDVEINDRMRFLGAWSVGSYVSDDVVSNNGSTWVCITNTTQEPLASSSDWAELGGAGGATIGDAFPTSGLKPGIFHYLTVEPVGLYMYYDDGDSVQWVQTNGGGGAGDAVQRSGDTMTGDLFVGDPADGGYVRIQQGDGRKRVQVVGSNGVSMNMDEDQGLARLYWADGVNPTKVATFDPVFGNVGFPSAVYSNGFNINNQFFLANIGNDANAPALAFDANDFIRYDRPANRFEYYINGVNKFNVEPTRTLNSANGAFAAAASDTRYSYGSEYYTNYGATALIRGYHAPGVTTAVELITYQDSRIFQLQGNGVGYAPVGWQIASDASLKRNIKPITSARDKIKALAGVTYERIDSGEKQHGFVADEVQKVLPEAVSVYLHKGKVLPDDTVVEKDVLAYDPQAIIATLVEAVKELSAEVEALKNGR